MQACANHGIAKISKIATIVGLLITYTGNAGHNTHNSNLGSSDYIYLHVAGQQHQQVQDKRPKFLKNRLYIQQSACQKAKTA